jgi:hypothetical protein
MHVFTKELRKASNRSGYLDLSRELGAIRQCGGGGRHGEEEEDGELGHGSESDQGAAGAAG